MARKEARATWIEGEKTSAVTYNTNQEDEVKKMLIASLGNWIELQSTPRSQTVCTLEHGQLNQPITDPAVPERYINCLSSRPSPTESFAVKNLDLILFKFLLILMNFLNVYSSIVFINNNFCLPQVPEIATPTMIH